MNKYLLIISLILISLLAVGTVSAIDSDNVTSDSVMSTVDADVDGELAVDEADNLEAASQVEELEAGEESVVSMESDNQSTEVLSEGNSNSNKPTVIVDDINMESGGNMNVPIHVSDSNGNPISGGVIVTLYGEDNSLAKYVKLDNGVGQVNFNMNEVLDVLGVGNGKIISDLFDIISSSINLDEINQSKIIDGFNEIYSGLDVNIGFLWGILEIRNGNYVDVSEFNEGVDLIESSVKINVSTIKDGLMDIMNGIDINVSNIIQNLISNITVQDFDFANFTNGLKDIIDELELSDLLDNISQSISFNKSSFSDALDEIFKEFSVNMSDLGKLEDFMTNLNLSSELKENITDLLEGKNLNFTNVVQVFKGLLDSNLTMVMFIGALSNLTNESDFNSSKIIDRIMNFDWNSSNISKAINKIFNSLVIDYDRIIDAFNKTNINSSKIIDQIVNITGINATKISNIFDGFSEILHGITFNMSNITLGMKDIYRGFGLNLSNVEEILNGINFNNTFGVLMEVLDEFGITAGNIISAAANLVDNLKLNLTDDFQDLVMDIISNKNLTISRIVDVFQGLLDYNNLTIPNFLVGLDNVTGGYLFNASKIIDKIRNLKLNTSKVTDAINRVLNTISINSTKIFTAILNIIYINSSDISDGLEKIFNGVKFNISSINDGLDEIGQEFNFNASKIISAIVDNIVNEIKINTSSIVDGLNKIVDSFKFNASSILDGLSKISDAIHYNISSIIDGLAKIIDSFSYDVSKISPGLKEIASGLGIDVSNILTQLVTKLGYGGVLSYFVMPDSYSYSFSFKLPTQVIASKVVTTYGNSKNIVVSLKDMYGKAVSGKSIAVNLNGIIYRGVTDANGLVSIAIPNNLVPKSYSAQIIFDGDSTYAKSTGSVDVVVSKLTPKIIAKKKTFKKSKKVKKYTITLKNGKKAIKKVKVTLKVKGKTYKAKTNAKGKAIFKIKKLTKAGTYKAVIKYAGNAYYNKATKNVKIVIK